MAKKIAARTLDFTNVKESSGINPKHKEEGEYLAKVIEVRDDPAKDGEAMWNWIIKIEDDATATYPYYVKLVDNQLWKLRNLFIAAGIPLPKKAVKIDPNKVVGKLIGIVLEDDEYDGKTKSVISAVLPKEELTDYEATASDEEEDDEDEEEEPAPKKRGRAAKVVEEEEEDEDEEEEEEPAPKKRSRRSKKVVEEEEEDEEEEEEPAPVKKRGRAKKVVEPEEEDDEEEEEEPAPKKRGRPAKAAAKPAAKKKRRGADDDDDLDLDL